MLNAGVAKTKKAPNARAHRLPRRGSAANKLEQISASRKKDMNKWDKMIKKCGFDPDEVSLNIECLCGHKKGSIADANYRRFSYADN